MQQSIKYYSKHAKIILAKDDNISILLCILLWHHKTITLKSGHVF